MGMTSLLLDTPLRAEQRDYVETIRISGDALLTIINDILDFSKIEADRITLEEHPFALRPCVEEALDLLAPMAAQKGLELLYTIADTAPPVVYGDVTRLRQILVNLVSNAVKFTDHGEVLVHIQRPATAPPDVLQCTVRDTGIGIAPDRLHRLFQAFSQVDASTTRLYGGTGLGLSISKRLAELMGGTMWVESTVGVGSAFHCTMKLPAAPQSDSDPLAGAQPALAGCHALLILHNPTQRQLLAQQLQRWGMTAQTVPGGGDAVLWDAAGRAGDVGIIELPGAEKDRTALLQSLYAYQQEQSLPLIVLSSLGAALDTHGLGATVLTKPIKQMQLYKALLSALHPQTAGDTSALTPLPVHDELHRPALGQPCLPDATAGRLARVLLAEDNVVNQKVAVKMLEKAGCHVDIAANGREAVEMLEQVPYDLVFMDCLMPEMDGYEATAEIRRRHGRQRHIPIIAMTANAMQGDREHCLAAGMDDYVAKPINPHDLRAALGRWRSPTSQPGAGTAGCA
jgi:CheY-like chemotaxis protein